MNMLRYFLSKFQGWRLLFIICWGLFLLWIIVNALTSDPVYDDPDLNPQVSELIIGFVVMAIVGIAGSFAVPSRKITQEEVRDKIALLLTILGLFAVALAGTAIYSNWDLVEDYWNRIATDCEEIALELVADQQCLDSDNCTMTRAEVKASQERTLKMVRYCINHE